MKNISLRQLRAIPAIQAAGTISNAAKALGLTGPAVTLQLRQLEDEFGTPLFDRTTQGMRLTDAGRAVLETAKAVDERLASLVQEIDSIRGARTGKLRLGVVSTAKYFAPRLISGFLKEHSDVQLDLTVGNRAKTLEALREHTVDIALMGRPPRDFPVKAMVFGDHPLVIIAPAGHKLAKKRGISKEALAREPFLVREKGSGTRMSLELFFSEIPEKNDNLGSVLDSNETIKQSVIAGLGIAFISAHTIEQELQLGRLVILDVEGMPIRRQWYSVSRADHLPTPTMAAFNDFLFHHGPSYLPLIDMPYPESAYQG